MKKRPTWDEYFTKIVLPSSTASPTPSPIFLIFSSSELAWHCLQQRTQKVFVLMQTIFCIRLITDCQVDYTGYSCVTFLGINASIKRMASIKDIQAVIPGDCWPVFNNVHKALLELSKEL